MKTEEDIKTESDTFALKREYKHALENLTAIKKETADLINLKSKIFTEYEAKQEEFKKILNDISQEKLSWATHRHEELKKIESMRAEADSVLKRKSELDAQEMELKKIEANTVEARNEARRLELKLQKDNLDLERKENALLEAHKKVEANEDKLSRDKQDFKNRVAEVFKTIDSL